MNILEIIIVSLIGISLFLCSIAGYVADTTKLEQKKHEELRKYPLIG